MADLNRNSVLAGLEALGSEDDQAVLAAARALHAQITAAGAQWEDLLQPENPPEVIAEEPDEPEDDENDDDSEAAEEEYLESEAEDEEAEAEEGGEDEAEEDDNDEDEDEEDEAEDGKEDSAAASSPPIDTGDDLAIIKALLARKKLFEGTRLELEEYKEDIENGEFTPADGKYLRALAARIEKKPAARRKT